MPVQLKGLDYFEHGNKSNTLYVSIQNKEEVSNVYKLLVKDLHYVPTEYYLPHITIAKSFPREFLPVIKRIF
jgi:2'-5' RNA ligase